jgi:hypothetical protein
MAQLVGLILIMLYFCERRKPSGTQSMFLPVNLQCMSEGYAKGKICLHQLTLPISLHIHALC